MAVSCMSYNNHEEQSRPSRQQTEAVPTVYGQQGGQGDGPQGNKKNPSVPKTKVIHHRRGDLGMDKGMESEMWGELIPSSL